MATDALSERCKEGWIGNEWLPTGPPTTGPISHDSPEYVASDEFMERVNNHQVNTHASGSYVKPDVKDTNPKDAVGIRKVPIFSVIPQRVIADVALGMFEGARKYGRHNYREAGVRASVYMDAAGRHMADWWEGQDIDPASGLSHVTKAISTLLVLRDSMMHDNWVDDRPPACKPFVDDMNKIAGDIIDRIPVAKEPFTEKKNGTN